MKRQKPSGLHYVITTFLTLFVFNTGQKGHSELIEIGASKDNTLFETLDGSTSNGIGPHFFVGKTSFPGSQKLRRGLLQFDIASGGIPDGSTIERVELSLSLSKGVGGDQTTGLYRTLKDWGEGNSNSGDPGGQGSPATIGDATWLHTFALTAAPNRWDSPGGDFLDLASATQTVPDHSFGAPQRLIWSGDGLIEDVQFWLDSPEFNFGWTIRGNEVTFRTAKRFETHEALNPSTRPTLLIEFSSPAEALLGDANGDDMVNEADFRITAGHFGLASGAVLENGDFDSDEKVGVSDLSILRSHFGESLGAPSPVTPVPEPSGLMLGMMALLGIVSVRYFLPRRLRCSNLISQ